MARGRCQTSAGAGGSSAAAPQCWHLALSAWLLCEQGWLLANLQGAQPKIIIVGLLQTSQTGKLHRLSGEIANCIQACSVAVQVVWLTVLLLCQQGHTGSRKVHSYRKEFEQGLQGREFGLVPTSVANMFLDLSQIVPCCL